MVIVRQACDFLKACAPTIRYLLTFFIVTCLASAWYLFFYCPLSAAIAFYENKRTGLAAKKSRLSRIARMTKDLPAQVEQLEQECSKKNESLESNEHTVLERVFACFKKYALAVSNCHRDKKEDFGAFSSSIYACTCIGNVSNIAQLFAEN